MDHLFFAFLMENFVRLAWIYWLVSLYLKILRCTSTKRPYGRLKMKGCFWQIEFVGVFSEEEKRKLCHSTSIKNLQPIVSNSDDKQVQEVLNSLVEKVDRDLNPSTDDDDASSSFVLFNASASRQRISSADIHDDLFQSFEDSKHSKGILVDENELSLRRRMNSIIKIKLQTDLFFQKNIN